MRISFQSVVAAAVAICGLWRPITNIVRPLFEAIGDAALVVEHPAVIQAITAFLVHPPDWMVFPSLFAILVIWWDLRRHRGATTEIARLRNRTMAPAILFVCGLAAMIASIVWYRAIQPQSPEIAAKEPLGLTPRIPSAPSDNKQLKPLDEGIEDKTKELRAIIDQFLALLGQDFTHMMIAIEGMESDWKYSANAERIQSLEANVADIENLIRETIARLDTARKVNISYREFFSATDPAFFRTDLSQAAARLKSEIRDIRMGTPSAETSSIITMRLEPRFTELEAARQKGALWRENTEQFLYEYRAKLTN